MNQGFWAPKDSDCFNGGEIAYDNSSTTDTKRPPQWGTDGSEVELVPNKKQAVEVLNNNNNLFSGMLNSNVTQWANAPSFQSYPSQFADQCYESEGPKTMGFDDKNFSLMGTDKANLMRKINENPFGNDSSFNLSISHMLEDPRSTLTYGGGFRKVKVSEVKDSENFVTGSIGHAYRRENNSTLLTAPAYVKADDNLMLMGPSYKGDENIIPVGDTYESRVDNFVAMGQSFNKEEENTLTRQTFKETMSAGQTYNQGNNDIVYLSQTYKSGESGVSTGLIYDKTPETTVTTSCAFNKSDNSILSMGQSYNKGESTMISFGGYDDDYDVNASDRLVTNSELLIGMTSVLKTEAMNEREFVNSNADALVNGQHVAASATKNFSKKKDDHKISKKVPSNNFPPNVRSLLSTGMLDGVPVKYIAWSREKELPGVIKGSGYLCGCQSCNYSKVINAFEFERHACCKTKHPNNHIYFENGKTIYGTVQELKSTPQNMLFDVIQTITGSPINQKSFRLWKESFLAATRELQRIYGNNDAKQPS